MDRVSLRKRPRDLRGYAIIIRQALKRWRGPRRLVEAGRFCPFRFSLFYCLQLSTNHFILTTPYSCYYSCFDWFPQRSVGRSLCCRRFAPRAGPFTPYSSQISNLKSFIAFIIDFNY